ncbi:hypothetical protein [Micrococcus sp. GbtcB5]|uniref:hypothetical protein n=1 Tax=Micrococcus sp. GbtcB5 TaxID=2824750 RepID=UPI0020C6C03E|nr:hypothetical protein [Micrococcus sp. GbtcB5]
MAPPLVGSAGVFAGLRQDLGLGWGLTLVAVTALGAMLALRGVHHRVEAEQARRNVFDAGAGSTAWVMLLMGAAVIPGLVLNAIDDAGVRAVVAGLLGAVLAAAAVEMQRRVHTTRGELFAYQAGSGRREIWVSRWALPRAPGPARNVRAAAALAGRLWRVMWRADRVGCGAHGAWRGPSPQTTDCARG